MYSWTKSRTYEFLSATIKLCRELDINTVAGPVMSGAVIASSVATTASMSGMHIPAILLTKPSVNGKVSYQPNKHGVGLKKLYALDDGTTKPNEIRVLLVDDIVSSGQTMLHSISDLQREFKCNIVAILSGNIWPEKVIKLIRSMLPNVRFFNSFIRNGKLLEEEQLQVVRVKVQGNTLK